MSRFPAALLHVACTAALTSLPAGCGAKEDLGPPQIHAGQQECERCRMIISEERFAAALVLRSDSGDLARPAFDDLGCLLDALAENPAAPAAIYVHDFETGRWLEASRAQFVRSDQLRTPMASQLVAVETAEGAQRVLARYPGQVFGFEELTHARGPAEVARP